MRIKDKYTIFVKNHNNTSLAEIIIFIIIAILLLIFFHFYEVYGASKTDYEYVSICEDAIFRATFVGDVMMGRSIEQIGKNYGYDSLFEKASYLWKNSDYVACNLESPILNTPEKYNTSDKEIHLYTLSQSIVSLKKAGFNLVGLANNHIKDYGSRGISNTIKVLNNHEIEYIGAGETQKEAKEYNIKEVNGLKIASIAITDIVPKSFESTDTRSGVFSIKNSDDYPEIIKEAKKDADIVIVYVHFGIEFSSIVTDRQEQIARNLINSGADIIIGAHSHTLQTIEKYNNGIIFYSLGNFIFDQGWTFTNESTLVNFSIKENGDYCFECMPILIEDATPCVTTSTYHTSRIFNTLTDRLYDEDYYIENNKLIIKGNFEIEITKDEIDEEISENNIEN